MALVRYLGGTDGLINGKPHLFYLNTDPSNTIVKINAVKKTVDLLLARSKPQ